MKYSPAPWTVSESDDPDFVEIDSLTCESYKHHNLATVVRKMEDDDEPLPELLGNVRLIAAAPEMYEIIKKVSGAIQLADADLYQEVEDLLAKIEAE